MLRGTLAGKSYLSRVSTSVVRGGIKMSRETLPGTRYLLRERPQVVRGDVIISWGSFLSGGHL